MADSITKVGNPGDELEMFVKKGKKETDNWKKSREVVIEIENGCEYSAYVFVEDKDGFLVGKGWKRIRPESGWSGKVLVPPGGDVIVVCTLVSGAREEVTATITY